MARSRQPQPHDFVLLDGFRGIGAVLVLISHSAGFWFPFLAPSGAVIVDAFFLISGFVIAHAYEPRVGRGLSAGSFIVYRMVRLFPLYLLGTVLGFAAYIASLINEPADFDSLGAASAQFGVNLFMLPASEQLGGSILYPFNPPAWTLFYEVLANLLYIVLYRWLRDTRVLALVVAFFAVLLACSVITRGGMQAFVSTDFGFGVARAGFGFFTGVFAYRLARPSVVPRRTSGWTLLLLVFIPLLCLTPSSPELRPFVDLALLLVLGMPLLLLAQWADPPAVFTTFFNAAGRISYALYILHAPLIFVLLRMCWHYPWIAQLAPAAGVALLVLSIAVAYLAERFYDRPIRRWIMSALSRGAAGGIRAGQATAD